MNNRHKSFIAALQDNSLEEAQAILNTVDDYQSILDMDVLDDFRFWKLNLEKLQYKDEVIKVLLFTIQDLERDFSIKYEAFFSSFSKEGLLKLLGTQLEYQVAHIKYESSWQEKYNHANAEKMELFRQNETRLFTGYVIERLYKRFFETLPTKNKVPYPTIEQLNIAENASALIKEIRTGLHFIDMYLSDLWMARIEGDEIFFSPKEGNKEEASRLHVGYYAQYKQRSMFNVCEKITERTFGSRMKNGLGKPARDSDVLIKAMSDPQYKELTKIGLEGLGKIYYQLPVLELQGIDIQKIPSLEFKSGMKMHIVDLLEVTNFLHAVSVKAIKSVSHDFKEAIDKAHNKFIILSAENFMLGRKLKQLTKVSYDKKEVLVEKLYASNVYKNYQTFLLDFAKKHTLRSSTVCHYEYSALINDINLATGVLKENIKNVIDLFVQTSKVKGIYQPLYRLEDKIFWIPSSVAYSNFMDDLFEIAIQGKLIDLHKFQTDYYELGLSKLFEKHGYKTIKKEEDKKLWRKTAKGGRQLISDFDTLAYKDGVLFNFEIKLNSKHRNSFFEKKLWYDRQLMKAANKQIPNQRKYILEHPAKIAKILGLSKDEKIEEIRSYIVSNTMDFDGELIEGKDENGMPQSYRKVNYHEIVYLLNHHESDLHLGDDYLKLMLRRIDRKGKHRVPTHFKNWAYGKADLPNKKELRLSAAFIKAHHELLWNNKKERPPSLLAKYLDSNVLFDYLDEEVECVDTEVLLGGIKIKAPRPTYSIR